MYYIPDVSIFYTLLYVQIKASLLNMHCVYVVVEIDSRLLVVWFWVGKLFDDGDLTRTKEKQKKKLQVVWNNFDLKISYSNHNMYMYAVQFWYLMLAI